MASREHERAVKLALRTGNELKKLFDQMGNVRHPNGRLLSAYRQARRALQGKITDRVAMAQIIEELRRAIRQNTLQQMMAARQLGILQARTELAIYGLPNGALPIFASIGLDVVMSAFETQATQVRAFAEDGDEPMILGDDERVGILAPGVVTMVAARWLVTTAVAAHGDTLKTNLGNRADEYVRQAVAAIDERTTNCCLKVNGQTVGLDEPFTLTGTPRYAREQMRPGFHDYCRTAVALVPADEADDDLTGRMRKAGAAEIRAREDGSRRVIHPAHSTSRRTTNSPLARNVAGSSPVGKLDSDRLIAQWVSGANRKTSILLKRAVKEEFNVRGLVMNRNNYQIAQGDVTAAQRTVREMYDRTQASLRSRGETITLYRGVKTSVRTPGVVESWTTDLATARKFNGHDVLKAEIPRERIFMYSGGPGWKNGKYGEQFEYMILGEKPK